MSSIAKMQKLSTLQIVPECIDEEDYAGILVRIGYFCGHAVFGMGRSKQKI